MRNRRIVFIGDSLAMPRFEIALEHTYPYLIGKEGKNEVISRNKRANTSISQNNAQNILDDVVFLTPDIVVIHLGIVDCAPRLFTKKQNYLLSKIKILNKYIIKFFSDNRFFFTKYNPKVYVNKNEFSINITSLIKKCKKYNVSKIYLLNISDTSLKNKKKSFNFNENIINYNSILDDISKKENIPLIDLYSCITSEMLLEDGIHLNRLGHRKVFEELEKKIND